MNRKHYTSPLFECENFVGDVLMFSGETEVICDANRLYALDK